MVEMKMLLPEELAEQIRPLNGYLGTVLQLSLIGFRTLATETSTEIIEFLLSEPTPQQVLDYHVSERAQSRLQRLLALNEAGLLSPNEKAELDEMEKIEHVVVMLKSQLALQHSQS